MSAPSAVPILETARLRLRAHRPQDLAVYAALWSDPEVMRYIGGEPSTREQSWARLLRNAGHWALLGFGYWIVEERASGRVLGEVGFANLERELSPALDAPEAGWVLTPDAHGQGLGTEAVSAILAWGDERFEGRPTVCIIDPDNRPSIRLAEKCGYRKAFEAPYHGSRLSVYRR